MSIISKIRCSGFVQSPYVKQPLLSARLGFLRLLMLLLGERGFIGLRYFLRFGKKINLDNPRTFNEKLNWLKLYDRNPVYTIMADKYAAKEFVTKRIGSEYVVPCYGVWSRFKDIDFESLPGQFVLKTTHNSCCTYIVRDKSRMELGKMSCVIWHFLHRNLFYGFGEWPYKNIPHRVLAEKLLDDHTGTELQDYKFWCFAGVPRLMYFSVKSRNVYENFYDMDFKPVYINHGYPRRADEFEKPENFEMMKSLAARLSAGVPFLRVDFFNVDGHVFFGEMTFYDWAGMRPFSDWNVDVRLGEWIELPNKK